MNTPLQPRTLVFIVIALVVAAVVFSKVGHASGLSVNASDVPTDLGSGSVSSCMVSGSSVAIAGQLTHGPGDAPVIGFVSVRIEDGSGNVLGSVNQQYIGPPFTSGSVNWTSQIPFTGQPESCSVSTQVALPPGSPFLPG